MTKAQFGLIGYPLGHSFSKEFFNRKFRDLGLPYQYALFEMKNLWDFRRWCFSEENLIGLNVTIPHKVEILKHLDSIDPAAEAIGAVNTIRIQDGRIRGFNTDAEGFNHSLQQFLSPDFSGAVFILGNGGSAKAVRFVLRQNQSISKITTVSRSLSSDCISWKDFSKESFIGPALIVNTTPVGMYPNTGITAPIPFQKLGPEHYLFDLIYNPAETEFLRQGKLRGCKTQNGLDMLNAQAEAAWKIWEPML